MLETPTLVLTTGEWTAIGVLVALTAFGLLALVGSSKTERPERREAARYIFGLGKFPRLLRLPELRDVPATPDELTADELQRLAKNADAMPGLSTRRYQLEAGVRRPWELSVDIPETLEAIEILREEGGTVWVTDEGHIEARPPLSEAETEQFEALFADLLEEHELRADRRTWAHSAKSPEAINAERV